MIKVCTGNMAGGRGWRGDDDDDTLFFNVLHL